MRQSASSNLWDFISRLNCPPSSAIWRETGMARRASMSVKAASYPSGYIPAQSSAMEIAQHHGTASRVIVWRKALAFSLPRRISINTSVSSNTLFISRGLMKCCSRRFPNDPYKIPGASGQFWMRVIFPGSEAEVQRFLKLDSL